MRFVQDLRIENIFFQKIFKNFQKKFFFSSKNTSILVKQAPNSRSFHELFWIGSKSSNSKRKTEKKSKISFFSKKRNFYFIFQNAQKLKLFNKKFTSTHRKNAFEICVFPIVFQILSIFWSIIFFKKILGAGQGKSNSLFLNFFIFFYF